MATEPVSLHPLPGGAPSSTDAVPARDRRVVRRIDPWSVFRVSLLFFASMFLVALIAAALTWSAAAAIGIVADTENVIEELFALERFDFEPWLILRSVALGGVVLVLVGTGLAVVMAVLYNLIAEVVGGVVITVADDAPRH